MSDRMPEDLPVTKCINVMVGITRSKVIVFKLRVLISSIPIVAGFLSCGAICWMQHLLAASTPSFAAFNPRSNCITLSFGWRSLKTKFILNYSSIPIYNRHILLFQFPVFLSINFLMVGTKIRSACLAMTSCSAATLGNRTRAAVAGREGTGLKKPRGWLMILFIWNNKNMGLFLAKKLAWLLKWFVFLALFLLDPETWVSQRSGLNHSGARNFGEDSRAVWACGNSSNFRLSRHGTKPKLPRQSCWTWALPK